MGIAPGMEQFANAFIPASGKESVVKSLKGGLSKAFDRWKLRWQGEMY
jgi:hypothetical protein